MFNKLVPYYSKLPLCIVIFIASATFYNTVVTILPCESKSWEKLDSEIRQNLELKVHMAHNLDTPKCYVKYKVLYSSSC